MLYTTLSFNDTASYLPLGKTFVTDTAALSLPWNDSGFAFRFYGTGFILHFEDYTDVVPAYLRVWTDGHAQRFAVANGKEKVILEDLEECVHEVRVLRVTEGMQTVRVSQVTLVGEQPAVAERPQERPLRLAFIGDSITCGYGVVGPATVPTYSTFEQDSSRSYAYMTADLLNAEVQLSGASGKGILANCMGNREDMTLRQAFQYKDRQGGQWEHGGWIPDLTVINAGTNDAWGGINDEEFLATALKLLQEVRIAYPDKPILWCYGVMDTSKKPAIAQAIEEFGKENKDVYYLPVASMSEVPNEVGAGGHPNTNTSKRVSAILAAKIREILQK